MLYVNSCIFDFNCKKIEIKRLNLLVKINKHKMSRLIFTILFLSSFICNAQLSKFQLTINNSSSNDSVCYRIYIFTNSDTIYNKDIYTYYDHEFDSLPSSVYKIHLYNCNDLKEITITKSFTLFPNKITKVYIDISVEETYGELNKKTRDEIVKLRDEIDLNLSYFQNAWANEKSGIRLGTSIGYTSSKWFAFSKHMGILPGLGFGLSHYSISNDTTFFHFNQRKKTYEYYNYLDGHFDVKLRFTINNQQADNSIFSEPIFDIGAVYNLPIVFKHITRFENNIKVTNNNLHQFTDLRAYVNIGVNPLLIFFEYRLTDFLIGKYSEVSKYNTGIRINIQ